MRYRGQGFRMSPLLWIITANLAVFLLLQVNRNLGYYLAIIPANIIKTPWTIFTSIFTHLEFYHIFGNMLTLFFFGRFLSQLMGDKKFLIIYFGGGLLGNIIYLLVAFLTQSYIPVLGASGAVFALMGALLVLTPRIRVYIYFLIPLPLWAVMIFISIPLSFMPGVAWEAHLGGLLFGLGYGWYFKRQLARVRW